MIVLDDDCRFVACFDVLTCDGILSSCHDFQIHTSYSSWFENGLRACIITLIWNLFACFLWNQIKLFLKYDFLNSPALLLKSLFCMLTCEGFFDDQFRKYVFFLNHHYFWNLFAFLLAKYVTGGLFDKRNEGSFFTWGFRLHGYVYPRHCGKRAIVLHCTQHEKRLSDCQNDFWIRFRYTTEWLANFYPERPEKSLETPPQCLRVIDQKWPLVVLYRFSEKWTWHLSNRISCKTFVYT